MTNVAALCSGALGFDFSPGTQGPEVYFSPQTEGQVDIISPLLSENIKER
jgi:hypothetical protein